MKIIDRALEGFFEQLTTGLGRQEMRQAMADYLTGLMLDRERKSIQPMAERLVEGANEAEAMRQRLQQCIVQSPWQDDEFRARLQKIIFTQFEQPEALVIDDTGFPQKGMCSRISFSSGGFRRILSLARAMKILQQRIK